MDERVVIELKKSLADYPKVLEEVVRIEKKIFPKHESLSRSFDEELGKKNSSLLYICTNGEVAGYVMYSRPSSLLSVITKLAGRKGMTRAAHGAICRNCRAVASNSGSYLEIIKQNQPENRLLWQLSSFIPWNFLSVHFKPLKAWCMRSQ